MERQFLLWFFYESIIKNSTWATMWNEIYVNFHIHWEEPFWKKQGTIPLKMCTYQKKKKKNHISLYDNENSSYAMHYFWGKSFCFYRLNHPSFLLWHMLSFEEWCKSSPPPPRPKRWWLWYLGSIFCLNLYISALIFNIEKMDNLNGALKDYFFKGMAG